MLGFSWFKIGASLAVIVAIGLLAFAIKSGINKIEKQGKEIATLKIDLATEKAARQKDVQGLTVLAQGMIQASSARAIDEKVLRETIDAKKPTPVSPGLAAFLDRLRLQAGSNPGPASSPASTGAATGRGAKPASGKH